MRSMSTFSPPLAEQIREHRWTKRLTQQELAVELGVTVRTVQHWEAGKPPRMRQLRAIEAWLET